MSDWWLGMAPAQAAVECGGRTHHLRWACGELRALDHEDAEAERTLAALGGQRCTCVDVLDAWARHTLDERVLVLASRGPMDPLHLRSDWTTGPQPAPVAMSAWTAYGPGAATGFGAHPAGPPTPEDELIALLGLGGGLPERLFATVAAASMRRLEQPGDATSHSVAQLHAALYGRTAAAMRTWLGRTDLELDLRCVDPGARASVTVDDAGRVRAELPFAWLTAVWSRGLATVMGRFCLAAVTRDGRSWRLSTIGPELDEIEEMTVQLAAAPPPNDRRDQR